MTVQCDYDDATQKLLVILANSIAVRDSIFSFTASEFNKTRDFLKEFAEQTDTNK